MPDRSYVICLCPLRYPPSECRACHMHCVKTHVCHGVETSHRRSFQLKFTSARDKVVCEEVYLTLPAMGPVILHRNCNGRRYITVTSTWSRAFCLSLAVDMADGNIRGTGVQTPSSSVSFMLDSDTFGLIHKNERCGWAYIV